MKSRGDIPGLPQMQGPERARRAWVLEQKEARQMELELERSWWGLLL